MGRHAAAPSTFDAVVDDYVTGRAKELIRQVDYFAAQPAALRVEFPMDRDAWIGSAVEILRKLTRDA